MAIINSIVMGKSRGKIGNVVTTTLKGQVIAKACPQKTKKVPTPEQIKVREKLANNHQAYLLFYPLRMKLKPYRKEKESYYNCFVRNTNYLMPYGELLTKYYACAFLSDYQFGFSNAIEVMSCVKIGEQLRITIQGNYNEIPVDTSGYIMLWSLDGLKYTIVNFSLTPLQFQQNLIYLNMWEGPFDYFTILFSNKKNTFCSAVKTFGI